MQYKWIKNKIKTTTTTTTKSSEHRTFRTDQSNLKLILFLKHFATPLRFAIEIDFIWFSCLFLLLFAYIIQWNRNCVRQRTRATSRSIDPTLSLQLIFFSRLSETDTHMQTGKHSQCVCVCDWKCEHETTLQCWRKPVTWVCLPTKQRRQWWIAYEQRNASGSNIYFWFSLSVVAESERVSLCVIIS